MDKQLTPIQKAIEKLTTVRDKAEKVAPERAAAYQWTIEYLQELLPEEKQFAEKAYIEGITKPEELNSYTIFTEFYKQYEDEKDNKDT